jgi:hypothetical protein
LVQGDLCECVDCGLWLTHSEKLSLDSLKINKTISTISIILSIIAIIVSIFSLISNNTNINRDAPQPIHAEKDPFILLSDD